jgi:hypothetical protein
MSNQAVVTTEPPAGPKTDIRQDEKDFLAWNQFDGKSPEEALPAIYHHAIVYSNQCRGWYWKSIRNKRLISLVTRILTFGLGGLGVAAPLIAAIWSGDTQRLVWSQLAVIALAVAGLLQLADRVFGWSSGWLRYISTVTAMENLTRRFQMEWALYFVNRGATQGPCEIRPLFELAQRFETQLGDLQAQETDGWIAEFNTGRIMLGEVIKSSREAADKLVVETRAALAARNQSSATGSIELSFTTELRPAPLLRISLDGGAFEECRGLSWVRLRVDPGHHHAVIQAAHDNTIITEVARLIVVEPGSIVRQAVELKALQ